MTHRERLLATIRGEATDRIPFLPRLDLWYRARQIDGSLPFRFRKASLPEIIHDLDVGYHALVPDFRDWRCEDDEIHRALGIHNLWPIPFTTVFADVGIEYSTRGDETIVEYTTPAGALRTRTRYDEAMRRSGITMSHIQEPLFKDHRDYPAITWLFEHAAVIPNPGGYEEFREGVGDRGLAVPFVCQAGSPMHLFLHDLMPMDTFFFELNDHPCEFAACAEAVGGYFRRMFETAADCPAEVFLLGSNYDATITNPPLFRDHIQPWLAEFASLLHARGRSLLTHPDGENRGLLDSYLASGVDVVDSICPAPMTSMTLREVREHFDGRVTIIGGIPSVCLLTDSMSDRDFEQYLDRLFAELGTADHLILGIADTAPPAADFERIRKIDEYARRFGPVKPVR
jgi:hypothetical protein